MPRPIRPRRHTGHPFQFVEAAEAQEADLYAEALCDRISVDLEFASGAGHPVPGALREEIEVLSELDPEYRVFGGYDGRGLVIRSPRTGRYQPDGKIVNVVRLVRWVNDEWPAHRCPRTPELSICSPYAAAVLAFELECGSTGL